LLKLLRLHLNGREKKSVEKLITNNQDRFHIPREELMAKEVLRHQIPTTDNQPDKYARV